MLLVVEVCVWRDVEVVGVGDVASVFFARMLHRAPNKALLSSLPDIHHPVPYPTSTLCSIPDPLCTLPVSQIHTTHKYPSVVEQMGDACQGARGGPAATGAAIHRCRGGGAGATGSRLCAHAHARFARDWYSLETCIHLTSVWILVPCGLTPSALGMMNSRACHGEEVKKQGTRKRTHTAAALLRRCFPERLSCKHACIARKSCKAWRPCTLAPRSPPEDISEDTDTPS